MSSKRFDFRTLREGSRTRDAYWEERAILEITQDIQEKMNAQGVTRAELARRLGKTPPYITKILRGNTNFTLETMVKIARALGCELRTRLQSEGTQSVWFEVLTGNASPASSFRGGRDFERELEQYAVPSSATPRMEGQDDSVTAAA